MKKILLSSLIAIPILAFGQTSIQSDNFDSYTAGGTVADQSTVFETWSGTVPEDAFVSDSLYSSAANSMHVYNDGPAAYLHDMIYPFPSTYTIGVYEFKMKLYVTAGDGAYFNLGGAWAPMGAGYQYGADIFFNADGSIHTSQSGTASETYSADTWFDVSVMVDLGAGTFELFINTVSAGTGTWGAAGGFGCVDIFGIAFDDAAETGQVTSNFYVDDVELVEWDNGTAEVTTIVSSTPSIQVVPNPSNGNFVLNYENISMNNPSVTLTNALGQVVHSKNINSSNGSISFYDMNLRGGVYFVTISDSDSKIVKKIIVR